MDNIDIGLWRSLIDVLSRKKMKSLAFPLMSLNYDYIKYLSDTFINADLNSLTLLNVGLSKKSVDYLSKTLLSHNTNIEHLNVSENNLGSDNIEILYSAIAIHKNIKTLNINYSDNIGGDTVVKMIKDNFIVNLNISQSSIHNGLLGIDVALSNNDVLTDLNMEASNVKEDDAQQILNGLQHNHALVDLNLNNNIMIPKYLMVNINNIVEKNRLTNRSLMYMLIGEL